MILHIQNNLLVEDVQDHFAECFPWLKLELYSKSHGSRKSSDEKDLIAPGTKISDITRNHKVGILEIKSSDTVGHIETMLKTLFGLNAQIFRKENRCWIQTTTSDKYSLIQQKEFSEHAATSLFPKVKDQVDEYEFL